MNTPGTLILLGTPIGNMGDLSPRAQTALTKATHVACEDTRRCGQLFRLLGLKAPKLVAYHKENEHARTPELLTLLRSGISIILLSDSGMPGISDPGATLVAAVREGGLPVDIIPGPTAVTTAVAGSGFFGGFIFVGFPPRKTGDLTRTLQSLAETPHTLVFYESPNRAHKTLQACRSVLGNRKAYLVRELTKLHEEWLGPTLDAILTTLEAHPEIRGECVLVIAGESSCGKKEENIPESTEKMVKTKLKNKESVKDISIWLTSITKMSRSEAYSYVQNLKK